MHTKEFKDDQTDEGNIEGEEEVWNLLGKADIKFFLLGISSKEEHWLLQFVMYVVGMDKREQQNIRGRERERISLS